MSDKNIPGEKKIKAGDTISLAQSAIQGTFYLVTYEGDNYFVNQQGKVYVALPAAKKGTQTAQVEMQIPEVPSIPRKGSLKEFKPGPATTDYNEAKRLVEAFFEAVLKKLRKDLRYAAVRMEMVLRPTPAAIDKYLHPLEGGLSGLKAYLIRELFANTTVEERGMEILGFLTEIIAMDEFGAIDPNQKLSDEEQKHVLMHFLGLINILGDTEERKKIFSMAYTNFIDPELESVIKQGGTGYYISNSYIKAMRAQRDFLLKDTNKNYIDASYLKAIKIGREFFVQNMLAYLKALLILRLVSLSRKEQRGRNEDERENLLRSILAI